MPSAPISFFAMVLASSAISLIALSGSGASLSIAVTKVGTWYTPSMFSISSFRNNSRRSNKIFFARPLRPRTGRSPPIRSDVSVVAWQFTMLSGMLRNCEISWTTVVLPHPVSPTKSTGSRLSMHFSTNVKSLSSDFVGAMLLVDVSLDNFAIST